MTGFRDEHYPAGLGDEPVAVFGFRSSDRRFWTTSGRLPEWISFGITDDYGNLVNSSRRTIDFWME